MTIDSKYIELPEEEINYFTTHNPSYFLHFCTECKVVFIEDVGECPFCAERREEMIDDQYQAARE